MDGVINLQMWQMASAYIFILILLFIVKKRGIPREKEILISTFRMTIQLILTGYILIYIFDNASPVFTILVICIMETFAIYNIFNRSTIKLSKSLKKAICISMIFGTLTSLFYFLFIVIGISPWYNPRYFIPIAGMLIGNSMTGISLGVSRLIDSMNSQKHLVESALMLGATPKMASKQIVDNAFDTAILPTINSMVGMGIVFLPGMMTGQILSGTSPVTAIGYQVAIMLGVLGSVSLSVILFVNLGYKTFFNEENQLIISE
ncbi:ABC transporter permease [Clostridium cochlearium]|jgi:putative ABC transport system permease protein|uniref:ABC transporter permease n=1 Tax=Clostridium cochlearium TaxID=1494 RepID=UPI00145931E3|nr:iron export ABC transporter permease subunit FetB [Clostridium cochlearium]MBU5270446.1 iron export ABC transporter permease subunit FetB [Clostridium cochlearium]MDU1442659.1 iron export ABC transporter permease subunit FetB [Clostridium cochlearium]NME95440.1 iron export ABC transporter permease subunit FetB [Clostridium cochlearium]